MAQHPGTVTFVDTAAGTERVEVADQVPEAVAYHRGANGESIPVVRVVATSQGSRKSILRYGADGTLLHSTSLVSATKPHQTNVLPSNLSPASLLEVTTAGRFVWEASAKGPVFVAAGAATEGLHSGREIGLTISHSGREYILALTSDMRPYGDPVRQRNGWFRRCELARLWEAAGKSFQSKSGQS